MDNGLEAVAVVFGVISVGLSVRENIWSWPTAIVNVGLYIAVFYQTRLYADMGLQGIYVALSLYGWYQWLYGGENRSTLTVSRLSWPRGLGLATLGIVVAVTLGTVLARTTDAALPYLDSTTTATSLIAQWLMTRKVLESWAVWVAVDVVYIGMFCFKSLYLTAALYAVFLVLSALGLRRWRKVWAAAQTGAAACEPAVA